MNLLEASGLTDQDLEGVPYWVVCRVLKKVFGPATPITETREQVLRRYGMTREEIKKCPGTYIPAEDEVDLGRLGPSTVEDGICFQPTVHIALGETP